MKNIFSSVYRGFLYLCRSIFFSHDQFSKILSHASIETFTQNARPYTGNPPLSNVQILYFYRDPLVQSAIHAAKYQNRKELCILFGELLWHTFGEELSNQSIMFGTPWTIIPIPISKKHRRVRGYNQTEKIAEGFVTHADATGFSLSMKTLCMSATHKKQTRALKKNERMQNIIGSFTVSNDVSVRGKNILLIDDVLTTGATLGEASRVLRSAGARHIHCLVVAH